MSEPATKDFYYGLLAGAALTVFFVVATLTGLRLL